MTTVNTATGEVFEPMSTGEEFSLEQYEEIIDAGLKTFVEVGQALATIRNARLYRATHSTFESYCEKRWNLSRPRAYQLIEAAEVVESLSTTVDTPLPTSERQARELAPLRREPEVARKVWQDVQRESGGRPTAAIVRDAVKRHLATVPPVAPQDEEFWNEAAAKATESGWVAKRNAERPYSLAISGLVLAAADITGQSMTPTDLAANIPAQDLTRLPDIEAAAEWLNTFIAARKDNS